MSACPLALLALLAVAAATAAGDPPWPCESEMNKVKDLLQVNCVAQGLGSVPTGLPKDTGILQLGDNRLARVSLASFSHLSILSELDLSNNSLTALEADSPLPKLQQLVLSHNALERLPAFQGLPSLWRLALDHNGLSELPEGAFRALGSLRDLELQGNRLRRLPPGAFQGLAQLRDLDLSDNDLELLPGVLLEGLPELEILRLERNRLWTVPDGFFPEDTSFAYVYLAENPWHCDCHLVYLHNWIKENKISVYTRTPGPAEEITENNPESVKCHSPAADQGKPVMNFQAACRRPGDTEEEEEPAIAWPLATTAIRPPHVPSTPGATPPATMVSETARLPSTVALRTPTPSPTLGPSTAPLTVALRTPTPSPTLGPSTAQSTEALRTTTPSPTVGPGPDSTTTRVPTVAASTTTTIPLPLLSTQATTSALVSSTRPPVPSTTSETTLPPQAATATSHQPAASPTAITLPTAGAGASSLLPAAEPAAHYPCPAWPAQSQGRAHRRGRRLGAWAAWLAGHCCLLHLVLYAACLALVLLPTLALLGGLVCLLCGSRSSRHGPALGGAPRGRLGCDQWLEEEEVVAVAAPGAPGPAQRYRVCKTFHVAPFRQASWLFVSLPGRPRPCPGSLRRPTWYSLDRGTEAIGAVRLTYATSSL
ncbi:hypothetical protein JRQ81_004613 [Phrynocephalus forsythii]|uniref:LRRCT domain-containing protein n=1 Tax=Phrynocephalus forsythii TaxID=171643 RepID=A0A9Q0XFG5_9SAUR|nr:hypothetical protein JRQ81_004613 [Phrynocephalus forsythii]